MAFTCKYCFRPIRGGMVQYNGEYFCNTSCLVDFQRLEFDKEDIHESVFGKCPLCDFDLCFTHGFSIFRGVYYCKSCAEKEFYRVVFGKTPDFELYMKNTP